MGAENGKDERLMTGQNVLVLDGPLRGRVIKCSGSSFTHPYAVPPVQPGAPSPDQVFRQAAYKVVALAAFTGTLRVATSYAKPDESDLLGLVFTAAARQAMTGTRGIL